MTMMRNDNEGRSFVVEQKISVSLESFLSVCKTSVENRSYVRHRGSEKEKAQEGWGRKKKETNAPIIIINDYCIRFNNRPSDPASFHFSFFFSV
jgi:hypothetical protein